MKTWDTTLWACSQATPADKDFELRSTITPVGVLNQLGIEDFFSNSEEQAIISFLKDVLGIATQSLMSNDNFITPITLAQMLGESQIIEELTGSLTISQYH